MSCASLSSIKEKEIQKKRNIKSRKIDKRKRKILVSKVFHNTQWRRSGVQKRICVMGHLNTNNFLFLFFYFSDFILIFFSLFFYFSFGQ